jgi:competence protein ComEC
MTAIALLSAASFLVGMLLLSQLNFSISFLYIAASFSFFIALCERGRLTTCCASICLGIALIGAGRAQQVHIGQDGLRGVNISGHARVVGMVDTNPQATTLEKDIIITTPRLENGQEIRHVNKVLVTLKSDQNLEYGDIVSIDGVINDPNKQTNPFTKYLQQQRIELSVSGSNLKIIKKHQGSPLLLWAYGIQNRVSLLLLPLFPQDEGAFLLGVVMGIKEPMSKEFSQALKKTGTTHMIVASGYNLTIIVSALGRTNKFIGKRKSLLLAIILVLCYAMISGLSTSIIRASIMAAVTIFASLTGRQRDALYALVLAVIAMLLYNPNWIYEISFQLSCTATLGIILFERSIAIRLAKTSFWLPQELAGTIAAQLSVLPIIVTTFQTISLISLLANMLVLWTIPFVMISGVVLIGLELAIPFIGYYLALILNPLLITVKSIIVFCAGIPFASVPMSMTWINWIFYIALIGSLLLMKRVDDDKNVSQTA